MEKAFATDDHKELLAAAGGHAFTYFDRSDRITKSASDAIMRDDIQAHMPPDSHFGVHLISMGSEEDYGPNRNGDSASRRSLQTYHPTFEKFGHVYREHRNRCPRTQGVGQVKLARYNARMNRGELIVWVEKDKAPDMHKKASSGEELSWSMSMRLPHDECSCCGKKSKRITDYCDHLRNNMLQYVPGFTKYAYARNEDDVKFFDMSEVKRRADRIATYLGYFGDSLQKAAAEIENAIITGSQWAEHLNGVSHIVPFDPWEELTLEKLAAAEEWIRAHEGETAGHLPVLARIAPQDLSQDHIETLAAGDWRNVGGELAKRAMFVNFHTFASIVTGKPIDELEKDAGFCDAVGIKLPSLMSDLFSKGGADCGQDVADSVAPDECGCSFSPERDSIDRLMSEIGKDNGMRHEDASNRGIRITVIKSASIRSAAKKTDVDPFYSGMVEAYGHYLVKAAHQAKDLRGVRENTFYRGLVAGLMLTRG